MSLQVTIDVSNRAEIRSQDLQERLERANYVGYKAIVRSATSGIFPINPNYSWLIVAMVEYIAYYEAKYDPCILE